MAKKRQSISKKTRFEIFKRDSFICQYCGEHPPKVILHIDHINPVKNGGDNSLDNLITSCQGCNQGKSANLLENAPKSLSIKAKEIQEREAQILGYSNVIQAKKDRIEGQAWVVGRELKEDYFKSMPKSYFRTIKTFIEKIGFEETLEAAEITSCKNLSNHNQFKYFCGVCWNKEKEAQNGSF